MNRISGTGEFDYFRSYFQEFYLSLLAVERLVIKIDWLTLEQRTIWWWKLCEHTIYVPLMQGKFTIFKKEIQNIKTTYLTVYNHCNTIIVCTIELIVISVQKIRIMCYNILFRQWKKYWYYINNTFNTITTMFKQNK